MKQYKLLGKKKKDGVYYIKIKDFYVMKNNIDTVKRQMAERDL